MSRGTEEISHEQRYLDLLYARLDTLRARAEGQLSGVLRSGAGTQQARTERDNLATAGAGRVAQLDAAEEGLCFGRLDLTGGERHYVGRIGILDDDGDFEPLLLDWRAPAARPFYVATSAAPQGVRRRRSIRTRFRTVVGVDDDVLDLDAAAEGDTSGLVGEGALLAALSAGRTGRMRDVVETIQAEQDHAIRSELRGMLVVQGGPGTGKTAVALHRAAYLLYTYRERLAKRGVLIVGPNPTFLRYVSHVLPALGETSAVLATVGEMFPGVRASRADAPEVAEIKGRAAMADLVGGAVRARQRVPEDVLEVVYEGVKYRLDRETCVAARELGRKANRRPNLGRKAFAEHIIDSLAGQVVDRLNDDPHRQETLAMVNLIAAELGEDPSEMADGVFLGNADREQVAAALTDEPSVQEALDWLWPQLTPQRMLAELLATPELLREAVEEASGEDGGPLLTDAEIDLLLRTPGGWSAADIPLLDEAAELLGDSDTAEAAARAEAERRARIAYAQGALEVAEGSRSIDLEDPREEIVTAVDLVSAEMLAERFEERDERSVAERAMADRTWTFGHVIVDEAQELSPMAWRLLMRRCPARSMTLVGDVAQTGDPAGATSWGTMLAPHVGDRWRLAELTVNYRTPSEIMAVAAEVLERIDPGLKPPRSVRSSGEEPWRVSVPTSSLAEKVAELALREDSALAAGTGDGADDAGGVGTDGGGAGDTGRLAVLVPAERLAEVAAAVSARLPEAGYGSDPDLERRTVVLPVRQAKGLEFDTVLVVDPAAIVTARHGENDLYVALTRATRRLGIVEVEG
ncbi:AAA family ATPase [Catenulispora sp. NL8]|uniref:AAA family ATPase n=1 Tax=Catenulispora pinistramenti TaxID=2705254 RepID=A0ABS5L1J9_9ACTN|nr:ATP-binding domain-containing protein [Catenulispora pinistramenti]MBS2552207.1 AAA family ATPase [Catenulispora pinistramenti]